MKKVLTVTILVAGVVSTFSQLVVTVSSPKVTGQKAVVPLALKNGLGKKVDSARAVVFLSDEEGKMVGQGTQWILGGGQNKPGLRSGGSNTFHFVITSDKPFATSNLVAKVNFSRILLEGGRQADVKKDVIVEPAVK
jgi:hypothetical protein